MAGTQQFICSYDAGDSNTIDDETGMEVKLSETIHRWDECRVTSDNWEERQPQDFPRVPRTPKTPRNFRDVPTVKWYTEPDKSTLGSE